MLDIAESADLDVESPSYQEIELDNSRMLEVYRSRLLRKRDYLVQLKEEGNRLIAQGNEVQDLMDEADYDEQIAQLNAELSRIPSGPALRLSDNQGIQPSEITKGIGTAIDLALLLLPGDAIVQAGTKIFGTAEKATKAVKKVANVVDKTRDAVYTFNQVAKTVVHKTEEITGESQDSILDMLSVSYWTEKIGKQFDHPPKMEIDEIEEQNRNAMREEIYQKQKAISNRRMSEKRKLNLIGSRQADNAMEREEAERVIAETESEMAREEWRIKEESRKQSWNRYLADYENFYEQCANALVRQVQKEYFQTAGVNITLHESILNREVQKQLEERKSQMESLIAIRNEGTDSLHQELEKCENYLQKLGDMEACA